MADLVALVRPSPRKRPARLLRVYVDEAGTRYISPKSGSFFVVSAVVVQDDWESRVSDAFRRLKVSLGRHAHHRLSFSALKRPKRPKAAHGVASLPIAQIMNVIVSKDRMGEPRPAGDMAYIADPNPMYLWALRLLLERISWFAKAQRHQAIVTFSRLRGLRPSEIHEYRAALEAASGDPEMNVEWDAFKGHAFRVDSPKTIELLQLPDTTASSTFHAVEPGADGPAYLKLLRPKLYRGAPPMKRPGQVTKYGLKVFPGRESWSGMALAWLRSY